LKRIVETAVEKGQSVGEKISVVIPAFNEADYIADTLGSVYECSESYPGEIEVVVVDNNSTDATAYIARKCGAKVVFEPINQIARARNTGAKAVTGDYLVFLDADTTVSGDIFERVHRLLVSGSVIGGGAWTEPNSGWIGRLMFKFLINYPLFLKNVTVGPFLFCERKAFIEVGGFDEEMYAAEEFSLSDRLKRKGKESGRRWQIIRSSKTHKIVTSNRKFQKFGGLEMAGHNLHLLWNTQEKLRHKSQCNFWYDVRKKHDK